jgi:hypothetical protein
LASSCFARFQFFRTLFAEDVFVEGIVKMKSRDGRPCDDSCAIPNAIETCTGVELDVDTALPFILHSCRKQLDEAMLLCCPRTYFWAEKTIIGNVH